MRIGSPFEEYRVATVNASSGRKCHYLNETHGNSWLIRAGIEF